MGLEVDHLDGPVHPLQTDPTNRLGGSLELNHVDRGEHFVGAGEVAQTSRKVDRPADVVVALEEDDVAGGQTRPQREDGPTGLHPPFDLEDGLDERLGLDADDHGAVTEPLGHPHPVEAGHAPHRVAEQGEHLDRLLVAFGVGQGREAREVDEGEAAAHPTAGRTRLVGGRVGHTPTIQRHYRRSVMNPLDRIRDWPVDRAAAATVGPDGQISTAGEAATAFEWASITKPLVATALLVAVEDGTLDLDEPAGPPGSTIRHLLAHASGLDTDTDQVLAEPGARRIYSNTGFDLLGRLLTDRTDIPLADYVAEAVLDPLGMTGTRLGDRAATGATGPVDDLARFAAELLAPTPSILAARTRDEMTRVAFPGLDGVLPGFGLQQPNDWGLGVEIRGEKHPHWTPGEASPDTFGHFGRSASVLLVDPSAPLALVVLGDRPFDSWAPPLWRELGSALYQDRSTP